jgi:transcription initiation factor TFIIB
MRKIIKKGGKKIMNRQRKDRKTEEKIEKEDSKKCPECGFNIVTGNKEIYCPNCGLVIKENLINDRQEWRAYDEKQNFKRARTGPPISYRIYDEGLKAPIHESLKAKEGRAGINKTRDRSFVSALYEIDKIASTLRLPMNIREAASKLYKEAMEEKLIRGHSIEAITAAIIYIVCRQYKVPRTLKEIEKVSWAKKKKIFKAVNLLLRELNLKIPPASPCDFVPRFCSLLELSAETEIKALKITKETSKLNNNGQLPIGVTAGAIYIAAALNDEYRAKKEIAEITGVSIPTIFNRSKEISKQLNIDMPETKNRKRRTKNSFSFFLFKIKKRPHLE